MNFNEITNKLGLWGSLGAGIVLASGLFAACYFLLIASSIDANAQQQQKAEDKEKSVAKLKIIAAKKEEVYDKGAQIYADYLKGSRLLPSVEQISQVLEAVEAKAGQNGNEVLSFDAFKLGGKSTAAPDVNERVVEGELKGDHSALVGFLRSISYYERITEVRAISAKINDKGQETLRFNLAAYYLPTQIQMPEEVKRRAELLLAKQGIQSKQTAVAASVAAERELQAKSN